jgi:hypothetical protein
LRLVVGRREVERLDVQRTHDAKVGDLIEDDQISV